MDRARVQELLTEAEWRKCAADPAYFIERHWMIRTVRGAKLMQLREPQRATLVALQSEKNVVILKARQIGYTTLIAAYAFWLAFFHPDVVVIFLSKGEREAKVILRMCKYGFKRLPETLRGRGPRLTADNVQEMPFSNDSSVESLPSAKDPARGRTVRLVVVDEWAFLEDPDSAWASIEPIADLGGQIVGVSTANGWGNFFHTLYTNAVSRINDFIPLFYGWGAVPERNAAWYETKKRGMPEWQLHQEYPSNPEEAFLKSGNPVFDTEALRLMHTRRGSEGFLWRNPTAKSHVEFRPLHNGLLQMWEAPTGLNSYVVGADVAEGLDYGDFSSAHVINCQTGKVAALWHGHIAPELFGEILFDLGTYYSRALVGCEVNNHGLTTLTALKNLGYPRIYYRYTYDERTKTRGRKIGWLTTKVTRPLMIDELAMELRLESLVVEDEGTIGELLTFVRDEKGYMHGSPHDDRVFSLGIGNQMRKHASSPEFAKKHEEVPYMSLEWWAQQLETAPEGGRIGQHSVRQAH